MKYKWRDNGMLCIGDHKLFTGSVDKCINVPFLIQIPNKNSRIFE